MTEQLEMVETRLVEGQVMTRLEARRIAREVASEVVLHDVPRRLRQAGVGQVWVNAVIHVVDEPLSRAIEKYLLGYYGSDSKRRGEMSKQKEKVMTEQERQQMIEQEWERQLQVGEITEEEHDRLISRDYWH